jgi:hypothetical protein
LVTQPAYRPSFTSRSTQRRRVAVRWQVTATAHNGNPYEGSCVALYRFENGRIAEDWGIVASALWP